MRVDDDGICNNFPLDSWLLSRVEALTSRFERHKCHFSRATGNLARQNCPAKNFQWLLILTRSPKNVLEQFGTNSRLSERTRMGSHGILLLVVLAFSSPSLSLSCSERQLDAAQMGFRSVLISSYPHSADDGIQGLYGGEEGEDAGHGGRGGRGHPGRDLQRAQGQSLSTLTLFFWAFGNSGSSKLPLKYF